MRRFLRKSTTAREPLPVAMIGVRMGERVVQIGLVDLRLMTTLAAKPGLSGRSAIVLADDRDLVRAQSAAAEAGILIEAHVARDAYPFDTGTFDVAIVHGVTDSLREVHRVVREGGRAVVVEAGTRTGLSALLGSGRPATSADATMAALESAGFRAARLLADKEGYRFIEALR
jgi:SAM-dependent methyltransferase